MRNDVIDYCMGYTMSGCTALRMQGAWRLSFSMMGIEVQQR
jgi:hypothetical protein